MPKEKRPFEELKSFIPEGSYESLLESILLYKVQLTLTIELLNLAIIDILLKIKGIEFPSMLILINMHFL